VRRPGDLERSGGGSGGGCGVQVLEAPVVQVLEAPVVQVLEGPVVQVLEGPGVPMGMGWFGQAESRRAKRSGSRARVTSRADSLG
jgi:hypothetical protein